MSNFFNLSDKDRTNKLSSLYSEGLSIPQIAEKLSTYPNKVRRDMQKLGIKIRDRGETLKVKYEKGEKEHPTQGKKISEEVRVKIGKSIQKSWDNNRDEKVDAVQKNLEKINQDKALKTAQQGLLKAAKEGSKFEKHVHKVLKDNGYLVDYHKEHLIANERLHIDLFLPKINIAIEIDGPTHSEAVFGHNVLSKTISRDNQKTGLILGKGLVMIRIKPPKKMGTVKMVELGQLLLDKVKEIEKNWPDRDSRLITIKLGD